MMMRGQRSENILTLMASIEGLHKQATTTDTKQPLHQNRAALLSTHVEDSVLPDSHVVQLNRLPAGQPTAQPRKPAASRQSASAVSENSNDDFDVKLAKLIEDVVGEGPVADQPQSNRRRALPEHQRGNAHSRARKTPYLEAARTENSRDIRSEIDYLLAPYLEKTGAAHPSRSAPSQNQEHRQAKIQPFDRALSGEAAYKEVNPQAEKQQAEQQQAEQQQAKPAKPNIQNETLNALLSPDDLLELNHFIKQEIKNQISVWITQNIDKIIEDTLRSARSEARNATDSARETVNRSG